MADREPFDPEVAFDALADATRKEVADAALRIMASPEYRRIAERKECATATIAGVFTGACGIAMAQFKADEADHRELLAVLAAILPVAFDQALSIQGLPPLSEDN